MKPITKDEVRKALLHWNRGSVDQIDRVFIYDDGEGVMFTGRWKKYSDQITGFITPLKTLKLAAGEYHDYIDMNTAEQRIVDLYEFLADWFGLTSENYFIEKTLNVKIDDNDSIEYYISSDEIVAQFEGVSIYQLKPLEKILTVSDHQLDRLLDDILDNTDQLVEVFKYLDSEGYQSELTNYNVYDWMLWEARV